MLTNLINQTYTARRPSGITMPCVVMSGGLGSSPVNMFGGKLGQEATSTIDRRHIRH